jgi:Mg2+-importing ATPase
MGSYLWPREANAAHPPRDSSALFALASASDDEVFRRLDSSLEGLDAAAAAARAARCGPNLVAREARRTLLVELYGHAKNPLNGLLLILAAISFTLGDRHAAIVITAIILLSVILAFTQEHRSNTAAEKLRALVKTNACVRRLGRDGPEDGFVDESIEHLVPGDIVRLRAGDMIPADLRLLDAKDLFVNQSALTGESLPVEKGHAAPVAGADPLAQPNLLFMGSNVVSGYATAVVVGTGPRTYFGQIADRVVRQHVRSAFEHGIDRFIWLMVRFMAVMVPAVFLINGLSKGSWLEALLFAVAVAVGLTPEMLPMIVTVNLAKGAIGMAREQVIVKRLNAIQNFGAMGVLCTDKTGMLTQDRIILKRCLDLNGNESERVLDYAYLNSHFQSGLKNLLDIAVLEHVEIREKLRLDHEFRKIDEIPFDFTRRRLSVVVERSDGAHTLICKGAVEEIFAVCNAYELDGKIGALDQSHFEAAKRETAELNAEGFRVVAVAYKTMPETQATYSVTDEGGLTLLGYIAFLDPPKESAGPAIAALAASGIAVKILTGDNDIITRKICNDVDLPAGRIVLGHEIDGVSDAALAALAAETTVFAKMSPAQKERVIAALRQAGHVVGYLGDGINDGPALKAADVGLSVDSAVDIAKESADIILLEKSLMVLSDGVIEGRKVFANITKYIRMGASSNFGNMLSVLGASLFLPFLPMLPIQVLTNNLLYDFSQTAIPTDRVDDDYLAAPRKWDIGNIEKFMLIVGPISSLFDYATFALMLFVFDAWDKPSLFQTGWFVESLLTQTLIIHIIRTARIPFLQSHASTQLIATTIIICLIGVMLPYSPLAGFLGLTPLPHAYWPAVALYLLSYAVLTHLVKTWFVRRWGL